MCLMCLRPIFPSIDFGQPEKAKWFSKAASLKAEIKMHEDLIREAQVKGEEPCPLTVRRLSSYRAQQYELSQKI